MFQLRLAPTTSTTSSSRSVLDDDEDAILFFLETLKYGQPLFRDNCSLIKVAPKRENQKGNYAVVPRTFSRDSLFDFSLEE